MEGGVWDHLALCVSVYPPSIPKSWNSAVREAPPRRPLLDNGSVIRSSNSESELLYDWWFIANQFFLVTRPLRLTTSDFVQLNTCGHSPYVTSSLTRGSVCHLQFLLALTSAITVGSESRGTHDHSLLSQTRDSPNLEDQVSVFISPQWQGAPVIPPGSGFPFRRLLRLARLRCRYSNWPPHGLVFQLLTTGRTAEKTLPPTIPLLLVYFPVCKCIPSCLLGNGSVNTFPAETNTHAIIHLSSFSVWSVSCQRKVGYSSQNFLLTVWWYLIGFFDVAISGASA
jgi:hypothetical protein